MAQEYTPIRCRRHGLHLIRFVQNALTSEAGLDMAENSRNMVISASVSPDTFIRLKDRLAASGNKLSISGTINHLVMAVACLSNSDFTALINTDPAKIASILAEKHDNRTGEYDAGLSNGR